MRFRLLQGQGSRYLAIPGSKDAVSAHAALHDHDPSDGYWVVICEDGTYVEYEVRKGEFIRVRGKDSEEAEAA